MSTKVFADEPGITADGLPVEHELPERVGVVVLGGGMAGAAAMLAAAEEGQYAILLEKLPVLGGSTIRSAGLSAFVGTDEQREQGIEDSEELLRSDLLAVGGHRNDPELVDTYVAHQAGTYRWLKEHGVEYGHIHAASGQSVPRSHPSDTTATLRRLFTAAGALGARIILDAPVERLLTEGEGSERRVIGVVVERDGEEHTVLCDAVVVATGGFARDRELLDRVAPQMEHALLAGGPGNSGDGMVMAQALGAGVRDLPWIKGTYGIYAEPHPGEDGTGILAVYKGAIMVDVHGHRFVDESRPYKELGDASLAQEGGWTWQVLDARAMALTSDEVPIYDFAGRLSAGMLEVADTVEELAERLGTDPGVLEESVRDYNARIAAGEPDARGRRHLVGGVGHPTPIDTPPYYAQRSGTVVLATYCGLTVDPSMRVLDVFGDPIQRLYAAGEVVGGLHGAGYMTGSSIGKAAIFGRIAGTHAAHEESDLEW